MSLKQKSRNDLPKWLQQIHIKVILSKQIKWRKTIKHNILFALKVHCWEVKHRNGFPLHELYVTHFQRRPYCVHHIHFHLSQPLPSLILKCFLTSIILCWEIQFWTWNMMLLPIFKSEIMPTWQERRWWTLPMSSGLQTPTNSHPLGPARCARSIMNTFCQPAIMNVFAH